MKPIYLSKETNEIQRVIALRNSRNKRFSYKEFIVEGNIAIDEASKNGWKIKSLFYNREAKLSSWAKTHLNNHKNTTIYALPEALMAKIGDKSDCAELIAIAETQFQNFSSYLPSEKEVVLVLDEPKSAGNVGMIIRSAAAFGANAVVLSGHAADEYDPKCIRSCVGTFFSLPIYKVEGVNRFVQKLEEIRKMKNIAVIASGDKGSTCMQEANFQADILFLVLGNETKGISSGYRQLADNFVRIPLYGKFTSLNIGAAASIFLYEIFRQRQIS